MAYGKKRPAKKMAAKKTAAKKTASGNGGMNGLTAAQKKLPPKLQQAILRKKRRGGK